ncbi:MAG: malto-oligosyltrehalose synthase, partial [Candidatus Omnitrophica bacterium CG12_big_fil_rev_8_21_14_0_65_50_5]
MASEVSHLGMCLAHLADLDRHYRDFTKYTLTVALREVIACYPVYRTYITPFCDTVQERDKKLIQLAITKAKIQTPAIVSATYDFIERVLLLDFEKELSPEDRKICREFVLRFQQITGPVMAKGVEDTAFYSYNRLLSLNEVGGDLNHFGYSVTEFHRQNHERLERWPYNFITSDTHDAKRSEDLRMRINVLSELPEKWDDALAVWTRLNEKFRVMIDGKFVPDRNMQYFIYQSLLGGWPGGKQCDEVFRIRFQDYILKAIREAKEFSNWINPNEAYETAVSDFIDGILKQKKFLEI